MEIWVAPGKTLEQVKDSDRLEIYQSRTAEWILAHAIALSNAKNGGLPALIVACSVIEPMGAIISGSNGVEIKFTEGFNYIFPDFGFAKAVYNRLRGGLYHEGFIKEGLVIADFKKDIAMDNGHVCIDPVPFVITVHEAFQRFCDDIRSNRDGLRMKFDAYWEKKAEDNVKPLGNVRPLAAESIALATSAATPMPYDPIYRKRPGDTL